MSVQQNLPTITFNGLDIKPKDTVKFIANFNEQQTRLTTFIGELNTLAVAVDQSVTQSKQAVTAAQSAAGSAVTQVTTHLQTLVNAAAQHRTAAGESTAKAKQWADSAGVVEDGKKGAKGYVLEAAQHVETAKQHAQSAQAAVAGDVIDDQVTAPLKSWSSQKINLLLTQQQTLINAIEIKPSTAFTLAYGGF